MAKRQVIISLCIAVDLELHLVDVARSALFSLKQGELPGFDFVGLAQTFGELLPRQAFLLGTAEFDGDVVADGAVVAIVVELFSSVAPQHNALPHSVQCVSLIAPYGSGCRGVCVGCCKRVAHTFPLTLLNSRDT